MENCGITLTATTSAEVHPQSGQCNGLEILCATRPIMDEVQSPSQEVAGSQTALLQVTEDASPGGDEQERGVSDLRGDFHNLSFLSTARSDNSSMNTLTNWLNNIKADDIDGGLAADFDGSLSGLGVELESSTYNMSEALLALPVFKQESQSHPATIVQPNFQHVLGAVTSPATKIYEETLTYLNQGQSYELRLKAVSKGLMLKSNIRVVFHERRLQYMEREQMTGWKQQRPGDRILDIDIPLSYGLVDVEVSPQRLNAIQVVWDPTKDTGIFIKVNCISTEFTAKKHGGEKGVPFRIQVETYLNDSETKLQHCASCQVKVFKPKGADRKNKTDKERIEKRSESEREKYQPSYACTVLTEIPLDQVCQYLEQLEKQVEDDTRVPPSSPQQPPSPKFTPVSPITMVGKSPEAGVLEETPRPSSRAKASLQAALTSTPVPYTYSPPAAATTDSNDSGFLNREAAKAAPVVAVDAPTIVLVPTATAHQVTLWLHKNRFSAFVKVFQNFAGADLLRLSREDLIEICGLADGIRLNNALQSKTVRPKLTIFVYQPAPSSVNRRGGRQSAGTSRNNSTNGATSPSLDVDLSTMTVTVPTVTNKLGESPPSALTPSCDHTPQVSTVTCAPQSGTVRTTIIPLSLPSSPPKQKPVTVNPINSVTSLPNCHQQFTYPTASPERMSSSNKQSMIKIKSETLDSSLVEQRKNVVTKRQYANETDEQDEEEVTYYFKKQRTRNLELSRKDVYHAVYLEHLSLTHLTCKLAALFTISNPHTMDIHVREPSGIDVLVTDTVVQNLPDHSRYSIEAYQDDNHSDVYNVLLIKQT